MAQVIKCVFYDTDGVSPAGSQFDAKVRYVPITAVKYAYFQVDPTGRAYISIKPTSDDADDMGAENFGIIPAVPATWPAGPGNQYLISLWWDGVLASLGVCG